MDGGVVGWLVVVWGWWGVSWCVGGGGAGNGCLGGILSAWCAGEGCCGWWREDG